jgi:diamine N-acetyltransferase
VPEVNRSAATIEFRRVLSDQDIAEVARLARRIWNRHYVPIIGQAQVDYMLEKFQSERAIAEQVAGSYEYFLIVHEGEPAGYAAIVHERSPARMLLSKIYVRDDRRGLGLGGAALRFVEDLCRRADCRTLWLTVNKNNTGTIRWYERMGFSNAGPIVQDIGGGFVMDDFKMVKDVGGGAGPPRPV